MTQSKVFPKTLILGSSGFIGSELKELYKDIDENIIFSTSQEVDILNSESLRSFIKGKNIEVVVNLAAFTNVKDALAQKGDKNGLAWKLNVIGAGIVGKVCKELKVFLVHISTDNAFYGEKGPSGEYAELPNDGEVDWYGYTKKMGEIEIGKYGGNYSIVRISYPFGSSNQDKDYVLKLLKSIKANKSIFADQKFTPTYIPTFAKALKKIVLDKIPGKFHIACKGLTTPYETAIFLVETLKLRYEVKKGSVLEYEKSIGSKTPYNITGGLDTKRTESSLNQKFPTWKEAMRDFIGKLPQGLA